MDLNVSARKPISLYDEIVGGGSSVPAYRSLYDEIAGDASSSARTPIGEAPASGIAARYEMASPGEIAEAVGAVGEIADHCCTKLRFESASPSGGRGWCWTY